MYSVKKIEERHLLLENGAETIRIDRFCTHEGGDLSFGYIQGDTIRCPLHNLAFCLKTGKQPCKTLPHLEVVRADHQPKIN